MSECAGLCQAESKLVIDKKDRRAEVACAVLCCLYEPAVHCDR